MERGGLESFTHEALTIKYRLDNEFELVFVVAYQRILQLSYVDKFLNDIQLEFRNKYKDNLVDRRMFTCNFNFTDTFNKLLLDAEDQSRKEAQAPTKMRSYEESKKSQKTVASMIETKSSEKSKKDKSNKDHDGSSSLVPAKSIVNTSATSPPSPQSSPYSDKHSSGDDGGDTGIDVDVIQKNRDKLLAARNKKPVSKKVDSPKEAVKKGKQLREWDLSGTRKVEGLDFSRSNENGCSIEEVVTTSKEENQQVGQMRGQLKELEPDSEEDDSVDEENDEQTSTTSKTATVNGKKTASAKKSSYGGFWTGLRSLVGSKMLTTEVLQPVLDKMRDHLIAKNVAADIAEKLCQSVASKLEGRTVGTFTTITSTVKKAVEESCLQILSAKKRVDVLRDALEAKQQRRPYSIAFCGVNGVGKSTNLAKVSFWLIENGLRVLIAACDTFRAGAVEQLRTHVRKLNALHPPEKYNGVRMIELYDKGYGKDAAGVAMEALNYARDCRYDVVLIDTAGRMQDNELLMRALVKLIKVNQPNMVIFVGEALVGNEAVDQLVKFNRALADYSDMENPRLIDGILLTKFDTIDDQVGAAISMTYTTGQPIVFVGTGQTYTDLKNLNARAVVNSLLKA